MRILNILTFIALVASSYGAAIPEGEAPPAGAPPAGAPPAGAPPSGTPPTGDAPAAPATNSTVPATDGKEQEDDDGAATTELKLVGGPVTCEYKEHDLLDEVTADNKIVCKGANCTVTGTGVTAADGLVTIAAAGNYVLQGDFLGQLLIQATEKDFVHLILQDASITSANGPAINALAANKVTITLAGNNKLVDSENYINEPKQPDACLYAKTDLSINGSGNLDLTGIYGTAAHITKDLKLISGNLKVNAKDKGIRAKNSICVKDATVDINSTNSAFKVTRQNKADKGYFVMDNGKLTINTGNDAIHGETHVTINDGFIDIQKCKEGIEAQMIDILGGVIHIKSSDDGINASKVGPKAEEGYPGVPGGPGGPGGEGAPPEGFDVNNPPPPPELPEASDGSIYVNIVGGKTYIDVTSDNNDGIDTNGISYIGGDAEVYISCHNGEIYGPISDIDAEGPNSVVAGATFVGTSGDMDWDVFKPPMVKRGLQTDKAKVYQPFLKVEIPMQEPGTELTLVDDKNNDIVKFTPGNEFSNVLITTPKLVANATYLLKAGNMTQEVVVGPAHEGSAEPPYKLDPKTSGALPSVSMNMYVTLVLGMIMAIFLPF